MIECPYCHSMFNGKAQPSKLSPERDVADLLKIGAELKKRAERAEVSERAAWGYVTRLKEEAKVREEKLSQTEEKYKILKAYNNSRWYHITEEK